MKLSIVKQACFGLVSISIFGFSVSANAAVVVSNLNESSTGAGGNQLMAMAFTTDSASYTLNNIAAPLGEINFGGSLSVTGYIYSDLGSLPETQLLNGNLGTVTFDGFATVDRVFSPTSGAVNLAANTTYWFVLEASTFNGLLWKDTPSTSEESPGASSWTISDSSAYFDTNTSAWASSPSIQMFSVDATASSVPVPAAAWLFSSALLSLTALKRKKKQITSHSN